MRILDVFLVSLFAVAALLLSALPGYLLIRKKVLKEGSIAEFSRLLIFITQPALAIYTFQETSYSPEKLKSIGVFALLCLAVNAVMLGGAYLVFKKKCQNPLYRVMTVATTFGNCAFFGIPVIEALFPAESSELVIYTTVYALIMNVLSWTVGSAIISGNAKYVSVKNIFLNPAFIAFFVALSLYVLRIPLVFTVPGTEMRFTLLHDIIKTAGRMATPLSMLIMGMRLATMKIGDIFTEKRVYLTIFIKQIIMPLVSLALVYFLPIGASEKRVLYIICACPIASIVLNYAEMCGVGQKEGASLVLVGTLGSIVTLPIMTLLLGVF
jgi:predicted permease